MEAFADMADQGPGCGREAGALRKVRVSRRAQGADPPGRYGPTSQRKFP